MGLLRTSGTGHAHGQRLRNMHMHGGYPINDFGLCSWYQATDEVFCGLGAPGFNCVRTPVAKTVAVVLRYPGTCWNGRCWAIRVDAQWDSVLPIRALARCEPPNEVLCKVPRPLDPASEQSNPTRHGMYAMAAAQE